MTLKISAPQALENSPKPPVFGLGAQGQKLEMAEGKG